VDDVDKCGDDDSKGHQHADHAARAVSFIPGTNNARILIECLVGLSVRRWVFVCVSIGHIRLPISFQEQCARQRPTNYRLSYCPAIVSKQPPQPYGKLMLSEEFRKPQCTASIAIATSSGVGIRVTMVAAGSCPIGQYPVLPGR
jgi:hypothetical protein